MKLRNSVNGNVPFEGDRVFRWRTIPAKAKILSAIATVTPVESQLSGSFVESLDFNPSSVNFGATKTTASNPPAAPTTAWVEVDFHGRRTLASVVGNFNATNLQVDVGGGTYVEINRTGAFKTPDDDTPAELFVLSGSSASLPGLTVSKLKLTNLGAVAPSLSSVTIRSVPTNVSLRVGELAPFWTRVGELMKPETTPDFTAVLQAALTTTKIENGFYDLSLAVHSDAIARLRIDLEIEFVEQQEVLPAAVPEVALPFDVSTVAKSASSELTVEVPANSRVVPSQTSARVRGSFVETRVAFGPTGPDFPAGAVEISPTYSQSQILGFKDENSPIPELATLPDEVSAVAVDLLLEALTPSARLQLDIRGDFDGKPDEIPLLPAPVELSIEQRPQKGATWISVPLPAEFLFAKGSKKPARYWLLLQCLEGRAAWSIREDATGTPEENGAPVDLQLTRDGGLSWQASPLLPDPVKTTKVKQPFVGFFRLRNRPKTFKMPISLLIGSDDADKRDKQVRKKLDRFEPLGRVDFTLDTELAEGINEYIAAVSPAVAPEAEHIYNGDFEQWQTVGDQMNSRGPIPMGAPINTVAFSPGGNLAYVLDQASLKPGFLLVVDVDCNQEIEENRIALPLNNPRRFVVSPDGTRAYVTNGTHVQVVNLKDNHSIGNPVEIIQVVGEFLDRPIRHLALSADGRRLYLVNLNIITFSTNVVRLIDTALLEQVAEGKAVSVSPRLKHASATSQQRSPAAIALSPDESLIYLLVNRGDNTAVVEIIDTNGFTSSLPTSQPPAPLASVAVGRGATDMALTPDGNTAVVTNETDNSVSIIDTGTRTAVVVGVREQPRVVALSVDGAQAYVFNQVPRSISTIDLNRHVVLENFDLIESFTAPPPPAVPPTPLAESLALSPQGDQMYLVNSGTNTLSSIQFGKRRPSEWQLTSGDVTPTCLPTPFHLVAELGSVSMPSALSQVVAVAESFPYEFSFWGLATESVTDDQPALAEVIWLGGDCGLIQADSIPIEIAVAPAAAPLGAQQPSPTLVFHRLTSRTVNGVSEPLTAPPGAEQAEIRFSVGREAKATIDLASLGATSELSKNGDFKSRTDGRLNEWSLEPESTPGFVVTATDDGLQLQNVGTATAELVQSVAAESGQPFTIEVEGKASATASAQPPRVELRWLKANRDPASDPTVVEILPEALDLTTASGAVPPESAEVEIRIGIPAGATLDVKRLSLRYERITTVPVKFIAESPGDLNVSNIRVGFERNEPAAPPIPPDRLCKTTPPGCEPGERGDDSCFCSHCEEETEMVETEATLTPAGRPATKGRCQTCSTEMVSVGGLPPTLPKAPAGQRPTAVQALPLRQTIQSRPVVVRPVTVTNLTSLLSAAQAIRLIDIHGIGERRAKQLAAIGIDSVEKLAAATPENVIKIKFITLQMATSIIAEAKSHITNS